jgi:TPR repeat protein
MYFYALCFETGSGVRANDVKAAEWYVKAAEAGNKKAIDWCRKRKMDFTPKKQAPAITPLE